MRKTGKNKPWKNRGGKGQPGRDGHEESVVATHSCSVQSEMLNEAHAKKKKFIYMYISYEIFTDIKAGRDKFPSLVSTLCRIRKVSKP